MQGLRPFKRYFDFAGRSGRAEYWQFVLIYVAVVFATVFVVGSLSVSAVADGSAMLSVILILVLTVIFMIPSYSVLVRRLHDRGHSGWWVGGVIPLGIAMTVVQEAGNPAAPTTGGAILAVILGLANLGVGLFLLIQCCLRGDPHENRYGPPDPPLY